jgi:hypothetical protein
MDLALSEAELRIPSSARRRTPSRGSVPHAPRKRLTQASIGELREGHFDDDQSQEGLSATLAQQCARVTGECGAAPPCRAALARKVFVALLPFVAQLGEAPRIDVVVARSEEADFRVLRVDDLDVDFGRAALVIAAQPTIARPRARTMNVRMVAACCTPRTSATEGQPRGTSWPDRHCSAPIHGRSPTRPRASRSHVERGFVTVERATGNSRRRASSTSSRSLSLHRWPRAARGRRRFLRKLHREGRRRADCAGARSGRRHAHPVASKRRTMAADHAVIVHVSARGERADRRGRSRMACRS